MCPFYRTANVPAVERRRIPRDNPGAPQPLDAPWCAHLYTPVTRFAATAFAGGWRKLLCAGDLGQCEVMPSKWQLADYIMRGPQGFNPQRRPVERRVRLLRYPIIEAS